MLKMTVQNDTSIPYAMEAMILIVFLVSLDTGTNFKDHTITQS